MSGQTQTTGSAFRRDRLNAEIDRRVLTNHELARMLGLPEKTVRRWRAGESQPQKRNVRRLAVVLDREPFWFYEPDEVAA